jgi:hypothetical protein
MEENEETKIEETKVEKAEYDNDDIFVSENNVFIIKVNFYKDGNKMFVEGIDDDFDNTKNVKSINITFKYPSYADVQMIYTLSNVRVKEKIEVMELMILQDARIAVLFRSWDSSRSKDSLNDLDTKILKSVRNLIIREIGMEGIL